MHALEKTQYILECPVCNTISGDPVIRKHGLGYCKCKKCDLLYANPRFDQKIINSNLSNWAKQYRHDDEYLRDRVNFQANRHIPFIQKFKVTGKLLDFGCGDASFVKAARNFGYEATGIDKSGMAKEFARKFYHMDDIIDGDIEESNLQPNSFDIITMWDVLEHLIDPVRTCKVLTRLLKKGGYFIFDTPNNRGISAVIRGGNYWVFGPRDHLGLFSIRTVRYFIPLIDLKIDYISTKGLVPWYLSGDNKRKIAISILWDGLSINAKFLKMVSVLNFGDWIVTVARKY